MHEVILIAAGAIALCVLAAGYMVASAIERAERSRDARLRTFAQQQHASVTRRQPIR